MRRMPQFRVMKKQCAECLFAERTPAEHREQVLEQCANEDRYVVCHHASPADRQESQAYAVCCRGFYDRDPGATVEMRLAHLLNIVVFVEGSDEEE